MNLTFKKSLAAALTVSAGLICSSPAFAQNDSGLPLIMTLKSNIYGYQGPDNSFTIYLGSTEEDCEFYVESPVVQEYIYVNPWSLGTDSEGSNAALATAIPLTVTENDNEVRIYGDPSKLDYIDVHGCYLSSFNLNGSLDNLIVIDLSHNELKAIDLTRQTSLASIDLLDNAFTEPSEMKIGTNHPDLQILSVGINEVIDPELDLKNFPQLQYFSARNNYGLTDVDPTGCPNLISLVLEVTNISTIDVSKNLNLDVLNISNTRITDIDLSANKALGEFYMSHEGSYNSSDQYKLRNIDLSANTKLQYLDLGGNLLTSIDVSMCKDLLLLYLQRNRLSEIDLSANTRLATVNLSYNYFTFATLPLPQEGWDYYYYRSPLPCDMKYKVGEPIDFSSSVIRAPYTDAEGNLITPQTYAMAYLAPRAEEPVELDSAYYTFNDGVVTFNKAFSDSIFIQFYCDVFPDWTMNSASFMIKTAEEFDAFSDSFSFVPADDSKGKTVSFSMGASIIGGGVSYPADVTVTAGDNIVTLQGAVSGASLPGSPNISFTIPENAEQVAISMPDGFAVSALSIDGIALTSINLDNSEDITYLSVTNASLPEISLAYNRALLSLDLSGNRLTSIDLKGIRGDYEKWALRNINLSNNRLSRFNAISYETIRNLNLSGNLFTNFDLKYFTGLLNLDLSDNMLSGIFDFSKVEAIETLDISGNSISSIIIPVKEYEDDPDPLRNLASVNFSGNQLTFATLPIFEKYVDYNYAPQQKVQILSAAAAINLSAQNITEEGNSTTFLWKYTDDDTAVPADEYTLNNGAIIFNESLIGQSVYCEMTNGLFPEFEEAPLTTTPVVVAGRPDVLVATLTTLNDGEAQIGFRFNTSGDNAVYIDWRGDGTEYEPYIYEANASYPSIYRTGRTYAGATAKIYSYDTADNISVFALNNTPLADFDGSPMTSLEALDLHRGQLTDGHIILPESQNLWELVLDGNSFTREDFSRFGNIRSLNLADNNYRSIDLSNYSRVSFAQLAGNDLTEIKFGNNRSLGTLDLTGNNISEINLEGLSSLSELIIPDNRLEKIDISPVKETLRALSIAGNYFTFATLPSVADMGEEFNTYFYANQKPMVVECENYQIDLSAQAVIEGTPTQYYWFLGDSQSDVYYDYEMEMFIGEELEGPDVSEDPEYIIEDGITTFLYPQRRKVICAMVNPVYPNLILYTVPTELRESGVETIVSEIADAPVDVYSLTGIRVRSKVKMAEALKDLAPGIYIINGKKIAVR